MAKKPETVSVSATLVFEVKKIHAMLKARGIVQNSSNVKRFLKVVRGVEIPVWQGGYDDFPKDRTTLLMAGFTFEEGADE